jgi:hypothetical protein
LKRIANVDTNTLSKEGTNLTLSKNTDSTKKFSETDIIKMLEFLIDNIFVIFGGQSAYLWVHTASLLADLFLYLYEAYRGFSRKKRKGASQILSFHILFRYIDDVLSLNNSRFGDFVDRIYPIELKIKDTIDTDRSASFLVLHLEIDSEGLLRMKFCHKRDDFNFPIVNLPFICSNIPAVPAYGIYISQLIRYSIACGSYKISLIEGC